MTLNSLALVGVLVLVLTLPFTVRHVEEELELFLLAMGAAAVSVSGQWSGALARDSLLQPVPAAVAVLAAGVLFKAVRRRLGAWTRGLRRACGLRGAVFVLVVGLGLLSSLATAVVCALVLAEAVAALELPRQGWARVVVPASFAVGLGSALTPLGGPLASIAVSRLRGDPLHADFFFLIRFLGPWVLPLILVFAGVSAGLAPVGGTPPPSDPDRGAETWAGILARGGRLYAFITGLVLLGQGFAPSADRLMRLLPSGGLFWANAVSAVLDNATLAAAELGPGVPPDKVRALLLGLLLGGGMLIPGNLPNMVAAARMDLRSKEWARIGIPAGLVAMGMVYVLMFLVS